MVITNKKHYIMSEHKMTMINYALNPQKGISYLLITIYV